MVLAQAAGSDRAEVLLFGDIGNPWDPDSPQALDLVKQLGALDVEAIDLRVNSYGGSVSDGLAIYNALLRHPASITGHVEGVAASMASVILMASDEVVVADSSIMMVHAPWGFTVGNAADMRASAEMLDRFADTLATAYARRVDSETARGWVSGTEDLWFTAAEAVEADLADRLASDTEADGSLAAALWERYSDRAPPMKVAAWVRDHPPPHRNPDMSNPPSATPAPPAPPSATPAPPAPPSATPAPPAPPSATPAPPAPPSATPVPPAPPSATPVPPAPPSATPAPPNGDSVLAARNAEVAEMFKPFRSQAHLAAMELHYLSDPEGMQAGMAAVSAALLAKLGEGIEPAGRPQFNDPPAGAGASDPAAGDFAALVQAHVDAGMPRRAAIRRVVVEHPSAHLQHLQAANPRQADIVAQVAQIDA